MRELLGAGFVFLGFEGFGELMGELGQGARGVLQGLHVFEHLPDYDVDVLLVDLRLEVSPGGFGGVQRSFLIKHL